jgi:predicted acylesterase/phospholipase RssA
MSDSDTDTDLKLPPPKKRPVNALVLGGGAPNFTLMTGALLAFEEMGFQFDVITGAGGGGAVALNYVAPKGLDRVDSLRNSVNLGVSDQIYKYIPMNYKVFQKGGKLADGYRALLSKLPGYSKVMNQYTMNSRQKLISDLIQAWWALTTPTVITPWTKGLCAHTPFIDAMVDFDKLKTVKEDVYISSYCVTNHQMVSFTKEEMNAEHFGASLSFPFIYPPTEMDGKFYLEGATEQAFNFDGVIQHMKKTGRTVDNIVVFNSFGNENYLQVPPNLWQAWGQSLITALIPLDRANLEVFRLKLRRWNEENKDKAIRELSLDFPIPVDWAPTALDWSRSNLERLFHLGYVEGLAFLHRHADLLGYEIPMKHEAQSA